MSYRIPCLKSDNTTLVRNTTGGSVTGTTFTLDSVNDVRRGMFVIGGGIAAFDNVFVASVGTSTIVLSQEVTLNNAALTFCNCLISEVSEPKTVDVAIGASPDKVNLSITKAVGPSSLNSTFSIDASTFKVGGKGLMKNNGLSGDILVRPKIKMPTRLSAQEEQIIRGLYNSENFIK